MKKLVLAACLLVLPAVARADGDFRWELTPQISYHFGGSLGAESTAPFNKRLDLNEGAVLGITFDIPLSSNLQLELLANTQKTKLSSDPGLFGPDVDVVKTDITYAHIGLLAQFGRPAVTSYFVGSVGVTRIDPKYNGAGADDHFSASLGVGVKVFFNPFIGLRFEAREFWTDVGNAQQVCPAGGGGCYDSRSHLSQGMGTVGLIFAW